MLVTLCNPSAWLNLMLQGFSQMLERSGTSANLGFAVFRQAFPWTIRDQPQVQSRYEMKRPTVQKSQQQSAFEIPDWCVTSSHAQGITDHQTIQIWKDFPCVRWARTSGLFPYSLLQYRTQAFPGATGIYFIQPGQYRRLRYLPIHVSLLLTAYGMQTPKEWNIFLMVSG